MIDTISTINTDAQRMRVLQQAQITSICAGLSHTTFLRADRQQVAQKSIQKVESHAASQHIETLYGLSFRRRKCTFANRSKSEFLPLHALAM